MADGAWGVRYGAGGLWLGARGPLAGARDAAGALAAAPSAWAAEAAALYGLALEAGAWRGRPSDPRRAALIQAAELLRAARPHAAGLESSLAAALAAAEKGILDDEDGDDDEPSEDFEEDRREEPPYRSRANIARRCSSDWYPRLRRPGGGSCRRTAFSFSALALSRALAFFGGAMPS